MCLYLIDIRNKPANLDICSERNAHKFEVRIHIIAISEVSRYYA